MNIVEVLQKRLQGMLEEVAKLKACQQQIREDLNRVGPIRMSSSEVVAFCEKNGVNNSDMVNVLLSIPLTEREKLAMTSKHVHPALLFDVKKWWAKEVEFELLHHRAQRLIYYHIMDCHIRSIGDKVWVWFKEKKKWMKAVVLAYGKAHGTWKVRVFNTEIEVVDKCIRNGLLPRPHKRVIMRS